MLDRFLILVLTHFPQGCLDLAKQPIKGSAMRIWGCILDSINATLNQFTPFHPSKKTKYINFVRSVGW
jgi:hypothetical protein